jgi:hypothetical protein
MEREVKFQLDSICSLAVKLIENGTGGGDHSHGGFVDITIRNVFGAAYLTQNGEDVKEINFGVKGDDERRLLIRALSQIIKELESNE